jgi:uncharacterized membrane protein (UPF0136 family)
MISPFAGQVVLGVYALLLAVGGVIGYARAGSRPSLIAGLLSAVGALAAMALVARDAAWGLGLGALLAIVLALFFGYRFAVKTRKFMPSGMLAVLSLVVFVVSLLAMA